MSDKKIELMNQLMDWYEPLLTEKQLEVMRMYYQDDYSLAEIADVSNTSRAAVHDLLKRTEHALIDYENKLHLYENYTKRSKIYSVLLQNTDEEVKSAAKALQDIDLDITESEETVCPKSWQ